MGSEGQVQQGQVQGLVQNEKVFSFFVVCVSRCLDFYDDGLKHQFLASILLICVQSLYFRLGGHHDTPLPPMEQHWDPEK